MKTDDLLSCAECQMLTGLRGFSLEKLEKVGLFPKHHKGLKNKPFWRKDDVVAWLKSREITLCKSPKDIKRKMQLLKKETNNARK